MSRTWVLGAASSVLCLALAGGFLAGCRTAPGVAAVGAPQVDLVWPAPPSQPRVRYVGSYSCAGDLGVRQSLWQWVVKIVAGESWEAAKWGRPFGIAVDADASLCFTDTATGSVGVYDSRKKVLKRWDHIGDYRLVSPVAISRINDIIFIADSGINMVLACDGKGRLKFIIDYPFIRPSGVSTRGDRLVVADAGKHCVLVFDLKGRLITEFGRRGAQEGEFNIPTHVMIDSAGLIYVSDSMNNRVQVFDEKGHVVQVIGSGGDSSGHFSRPKGVAVDSEGHVYVVDALFDNIQIFDRNGVFLLDIGSPGSAPGEFWLPAGIAIGNDNRIYVADSYNRRIQVFQYLASP